VVEGHSLRIVIPLISTAQKPRLKKPVINGAYRLLQHLAGKLHRSSGAAVVPAVPLEPAAEDHAAAVVDPGVGEEQVQDHCLLDWP
jgi:hypothetical protein